MEDRLILDFHSFRRKELADQVVAAMQEVAPGGLFEDRADCQTLWDEACWAIQEPDDLTAQEAASDTIEQFATAYTADLSAAELRLHAYLLTDDTDETGLPFPDAAALGEDIADVVKERAAARDLSDLELS